MFPKEVKNSERAEKEKHIQEGQVVINHEIRKIADCER